MGRRRTKSDAELLRAARAAFVEQGAAASTRDIAERAGVSEGVLFQRFGTKAELLLAAMAPPMHHLEVAGPSNRSAGSGHRRLGQVVRELVDYFREATPVLLPLVSDPRFDFEAFASRHPDSSLSALRRDLVRHLASERDAGRLGAVEPGPAALLLVSLAQSVALFERLGAHGGRMSDRVVDQAVDCLWNGLAPADRTRQRRRRRSDAARADAPSADGPPTSGARRRPR